MFIQTPKSISSNFICPLNHSGLHQFSLAQDQNFIAPGNWTWVFSRPAITKLNFYFVHSP